MRTTKLAAVLVSFAAAFFCLNAQTAYLEVDHILANPAPLQMEINAVLLDSRGWLWIGSVNGLARYDGYRVIPCRIGDGEKTAVADPSVRGICEGPGGRLWLATARGLVSFDPDRSRSVRFRHDERRPDTISADDLTCLYVSPALPGRLWIATADGGLDQLELASGKITRTPAVAADAPRPGRIHVISGDRAGFLWVGAANGLYRFQPLDNSLQFCPLTGAASGSKKSVGVKAILCDEGFANALWIGSEGAGLLRYLPDTGLWQRCLEKGSASDPSAGVNVNAIARFPGEPQNLILGTDNGLFRFDPLANLYTRIAMLFNDTDMQTSQCTRVIYGDPLGSFWIGSCRSGLDKWSPLRKKFSRFRPNSDKLPSSLANWVTSLREFADHELLLTTYGGGAFIFDRRTSTFRRLLLDPDRAGRKLNSFITNSDFDRDGSLWFTTTEGLARCSANGRLQRLYRLNPDKADTSDILAFSFIRDGSGCNWIGTDRGLIRLDCEKGDMHVYRQDRHDARSLSNDRVNSIMLEAGGALWIGTDDGLNLLQPGRDGFTIFKHDPSDPESVSSSHVTYMEQDSRGRVWICTANGVNLLQRAGGKITFRHFLAPGDNSRQNSFLSMVEENDRHFWLGSKAGLARFDSQLGTFTFYDRRDGVVADGLNEAFFFYRCRDNEIYFGGRFGFTAFRPAEFRLNNHPPPLVMTELRIEQDLESTTSMRTTGRKNVRVELAALDFVRPEKNQYAYRLEGRDRDWIYQGTDRVVLLSGLPIGLYTLRVKAANNDGIWNEEGISMQIKVRPPFLEQYGLALLAAGVLAVLAAVVLWARRRSRRLRSASIPDSLDLVLEKFAISKREAEIVRLLLAGKSNKEIEDALFIALATVKIHVHNIFQKVKVSNRLQLLLRIQQEAKKLE
ncbi:MAG: LuxR C-terminal-related transcriptional regulator [Candidatus Aminicenantes bacterium]|nr:LuxR C-terminal-related transcriptional regulator [Candidatus Aminicenantes bacterium]